MSIGLETAVYPNYETYNQIHKTSDIPGRTSRICYADNDSVPPEKRGKEISDEDYEKLSKQLVGAKCPKPSAIKQFFKKLEEMFAKKAEKPITFTVNDLQEKGEKVLDLYDAYQNYRHTSTNQHQNNKTNVYPNNVYYSA